MKKPTQIHQFDPVIYPFKFWVAVTDKIETLQDRFTDNKKKELEGDISKHKAVACNVISKDDTGYNWVLVVFTHKTYMTPDVMAHEAYHASQTLWEYIQEEHPSEEATAYLIGWFVDCINQVRTNKFK